MTEWGIVSFPPGAQLALQAAGLVGTWDTDVETAHSILDAGAAALLAGDAKLAGRPLPLEIALQRTHPADRDWVFDRIHRTRRTGGPFSAEFRVRTVTGGVRWVLNLGTLAPDEAGRMCGRGCYIDTTGVHGKAGWQSGRVAVAEQRVADIMDPLIAASDLTIEAHAEIVRTGDRTLRQASEAILWLLGRAIAQREHV